MFRKEHESVYLVYDRYSVFKLSWYLIPNVIPMHFINNIPTLIINNLWVLLIAKLLTMLISRPNHKP